MRQTVSMARISDFETQKKTYTEAHIYFLVLVIICIVMREGTNKMKCNLFLTNILLQIRLKKPKYKISLHIFYIILCVVYV